MRSDHPKTIQLKIPGPLHARVKMHAAWTGTSIRQLILEVLDHVAAVERWGHEIEDQGAAA